MNEQNRNNYPNYVTVEGDGKEYPSIYCPACGKETIHTNERCSHLLFCCEDSVDGFSFGYVHPKLEPAVKMVKEKYVGSLSEGDTEDVDPTAWDKYDEDKIERLSFALLAVELRLDPNSTLVLCIENMMDGLGAGYLVEVAVGIEFPAGSKSLKAIKRRFAENEKRS